VVRTIESIIADLDRKLSEQVYHILHHAEFQ
jgi:type VI secretion system protein ImpC